MNFNLPRKASLFTVLVILFSGACNAAQETPTSKTAIPSQQSTATTTSIPTETPEPTKSDLITNIIDAQKAVIKIQSMGNFSDPETGELNIISGRGSGFIIHPSGIAVTNDHVVTGAEEIKVWVGDDISTSHSAKLIGVSECANLAIIDIDGDGYSYFDWSQDKVEIGQELYTAGFKLSEPVYSLSRGVIVSLDVEGQRSWIYLDAMIEHTADASPGFTGGPLLLANAKVVGVNFGEKNSNQQKLGISNEIAKPIVEELLIGEKNTTFGINGQLFSDDEEEIKGIWISSVQPGSFADEAGLEAGDIITKLGDKNPGAGGTIEEYCEEINSFNSDDPIQIEISRPSTGQEFRGKIGSGELLSSATPEGFQKTPLVEQTQVPTFILNDEANQPGEVIFDYGFEKEISEWESFVTNGDPTSVRSGIVDENFHVEFSNVYTYQYYIFDLFEIEDVKLELRAANLGGNNNNISLVCRNSEAGWYEFNVASNGLYWIYLYDPDLEEPYKQLWNGGSFNINLGKEENVYSAICNGEDLTLLINGEEAITVKDQSLTIGKVGFSVSSYNVTPVIVEVEQFTASVPK